MVHSEFEMNKKYAMENGYVRFDGNMTLALLISAKCRQQGLFYNEDYRWKMLGPSSFEFHFKDLAFASWAILTFQ
jgi:hypothetical protein